MKTSFDIYHEGIAKLRRKLNGIQSQKERLALLLTIAERLAYIAPDETINSTIQLLTDANQLEDLEAIVRARNTLAYCHITKYEFDVAEQYLLANEQKLLEVNINLVLLYDTYSYIARLYALKSEFKKANYYLDQCIDICHQMEEDVEKGSDKNKLPKHSSIIGFQLNVYGRIAQNHLKMGNIKRARNYIQIALTRDDNLPTVDHAILYNVIGISYANEEAFTKAIDFYEKALKIWEEAGYYFYSSFVFNNLAIIYQNQEKYTEALEYSQKSMVLFRKIAYKRNIAMVYSNMGYLYLKKKEVDKCIEYENKAREIYLEINDKHEYLAATTVLVEAFLEKNEPESALEKLKEAEQIQKESKFNQSREIHRLYNLYYRKVKNYKKAFEHNQDYILLNDQIKDETIQELERKYEAVIKEKEMAELHIKQKSLKTHNYDLENFAAKAGHDLKAPIATINMYCHLIRSSIEQQQKETTSDYLEVVKTSANSIMQLITDLTAYTLAGSDELEKEELNLDDLLFIVENNLREQITRTKAQVICKQKLPTVSANYRGMNQIIQNIISNGIKFQKSDNAPIIKIECNQDNDFWELKISDNGIGIAEKNHDKIFNVFERLHSNEEYEGSGIGLATCRKIARQMGGDISLKSKYGEGTTFLIYIPINKVA